MLQDELAHPSLVRTNRHLSYPIVSIVHHLRASERRLLAPLYRAIERRYLATVDGVVCNSRPTRASVTALGVDPAATVIAPPAGDRWDPDLDAETISRRGRGEPLRVVFVGTLTPRKGLDTLIEGVVAAETNVAVTVVGNPENEAYVDRVRQMVDRYGLGDRVRLTGELSTDRLEETLGSSHVLAVPSHYEGFGIVYLEGMSFGLPALATRAGGASDVVTHDETGVLVDPDDPNGVARELERFAADRDRLVRMGLAARRRYQRQPDWEETTARIRGFLADIAGVTA